MRYCAVGVGLRQDARIELYSGYKLPPYFSWPETERPAILNVETSVAFATVDSVQGWRNPTLVGWPGIHISLPDNVAVLIAARSN